MPRNIILYKAYPLLPHPTLCAPTKKIFFKSSSKCGCLQLPTLLLCSPFFVAYPVSPWGFLCLSMTTTTSPRKPSPGVSKNTCRLPASHDLESLSQTRKAEYTEKEKQGREIWVSTLALSLTVKWPQTRHFIF